MKTIVTNQATRQSKYEAKRRKMLVSFNLEIPNEAKLYKKARAMDNFSGSVKQFIADQKTDDKGE